MTAPSANGGTTITVNNVKPTAVITGPASGSIYPVGTTVTFSGSFTDVGKNDSHANPCTPAWTCTYWTFDTIKSAGVVTETVGTGTGTVSGSYTFTAPGVYNIKLTVTDDDGGFGEATTVNGMPAMIVIYDPSAGFVTGGGYITHNPGTMTPAASVGKDNFGFVSKYKKGASVPDGETEFQCKVCDINFHSTSYDWLVVQQIPGGYRAQFMGSGTINGTGSYGFLATVIDKGNTDTFRIRIWNKNAGNAVVYDNEPTLADSTNPTTITSGGNIVIHAK